jgi:hypothetical protein
MTDSVNQRVLAGCEMGSGMLLRALGPGVAQRFSISPPSSV